VVRPSYVAGKVVIPATQGLMPKRRVRGNVRRRHGALGHQVAGGRAADLTTIQDENELGQVGQITLPLRGLGRAGASGMPASALWGVPGCVGAARGYSGSLRAERL
jgi:hypothetical protein